MIRGSVYFLLAEEIGRVKIGWSSSPMSRIGGIRTSSPFPLKLLGTVNGTIETERALHRTFGSRRVNGEWFSCDETMISEIYKMIDEGGRERQFWTGDHFVSIPISPWSAIWCRRLMKTASSMVVNYRRLMKFQDKMSDISDAVNDSLLWTSMMLRDPYKKLNNARIASFNTGNDSSFPLTKCHRHVLESCVGKILALGTHIIPGRIIESMGEESVEFSSSSYLIPYAPGIGAYWILSNIDGKRWGIPERVGPAEESSRALVDGLIIRCGLGA